MSSNPSKKRKHTTDAERIAAIREYRKQYYKKNAEVIKARASAWNNEHFRPKVLGDALHVKEPPIIK